MARSEAEALSEGGTDRAWATAGASGMAEVSRTEPSASGGERRTRAAFAAKTGATSGACALVFTGAAAELRVVAVGRGCVATQFNRGGHPGNQGKVFRGGVAVFPVLVPAGTFVSGPPPHSIVREL